MVMMVLQLNEWYRREFSSALRVGEGGLDQLPRIIPVWGS